ncbi:hypothetical protein D7V90_16685 [bacterium 1xD42-87]|nr:hypothetical protein D7V90_16685 [bacterium 1xD42-87]
MHTIGKINRDIYKCVTEDIVTDEVIITDERIAHIIQRRGKTFIKNLDNILVRFLEIRIIYFPIRKIQRWFAKKLFMMENTLILRFVWLHL